MGSFDPYVHILPSLHAVSADARTWPATIQAKATGIDMSGDRGGVGAAHEKVMVPLTGVGVDCENNGLQTLSPLRAMVSGN